MIKDQTMVRDYVLIKKIGTGGMGEVWLGDDSNLERRVAIKILNPQLSSDPDLVARFRHEAKLQARLVHKNIVTLYNFFTEQGRSYMVMEFAQGVTVKELIRREGMLSEQRTLGILNQLLDALAYAHSMGIIHRDIKPANIMVDPDNNDFVKIMDFGIAKALGEAGLTQTGTRMGTPFYMSPEQIRAEKDIDYRTDIYSLGVTLHEMVTGRLPFDADSESPYTIQHNIITQEFADPRSVHPGMSDSFCAVLKRMTEKNKEKRYSSVMEINLEKPEHVGKYSQPKPDLDTKTVIRPEGLETVIQKIPDPALPGVSDRGYAESKKFVLSVVLALCIYSGLPFLWFAGFRENYLIKSIRLGCLAFLLIGYYLYLRTPRIGLTILWIASILFFVQWSLYDVLRLTERLIFR